MPAPASDVLPYGTYEVRESQTNESMLLTWTGETVTVRQQGHAVSVTAVDEVERGGLSVEKQDTITGSTPQGDADFEGITFQIINNSRKPRHCQQREIRSWRSRFDPDYGRVGAGRHCGRCPALRRVHFA